MSFKTGIPYADHTFNTHWGCTPIPGDPACANCYARRESRRYGLDIFGLDRPRRFFGPGHWREPFRWQRLARRDGRLHRVLADSMGDVFEDYGPADPRDPHGLEYWRQKLWDLVRATPHLFYLLLTKRPENIGRMLPADLQPASNLGFGVTAANQEWAERRLPVLLSVPATLHFVSAEPQLGALDLARIALPGGHSLNALTGRVEGEGLQYARLDWVIAGGESGPAARQTHPEWVRALLRQCRATGVAFYYKQVGEWAPVAPYPEATGDVHLRPDGSPTDGPERWEDGSPSQVVTMRRVGRRSAGDTLDGERYQEVPALLQLAGVEARHGR